MLLINFLKRFGFFLILGMINVVQTSALNIATLPAADSLVLEIAVDQGIFSKYDLDIKLLPFKSALEVGAAFRAGKISGQFGDLINVIMQCETGITQKVVAVTTHTEKKQRRFALVTSPQMAPSLQKLSELKHSTTAMSADTIIEYLLDALLDEQNLANNALSFKEIKQIPIRLQMLLAGKIDTALLPEPLVTLAEHKGGRVLWDDRNLNETLAVISIQDRALNANEQELFCKALDEAASFIKENPEVARELMLKKRLLPKNIADDYAMMDLCNEQGKLPALPSKEEFTRVVKWMLEHHMIKRAPLYEDIVFSK